MRQNIDEYTITHTKKVKQIGKMTLVQKRIAKRFTFLEYVFGGCEISLFLAVDFTLSNGDPKDP